MNHGAERAAAGEPNVRASEVGGAAGRDRSPLGADYCVGENEDARVRGMEPDGPTSGSDRRRHGAGRPVSVTAQTGRQDGHET